MLSDGDVNSVFLSDQATIPEPAHAAILLGATLFGLLVWRRRAR